MDRRLRRQDLYLFFGTVLLPLVIGIIMYQFSDCFWTALRNFGPDFLWMFAFTSTMIILNRNPKDSGAKNQWKWVFVALFLSFLWEWMQSLQPFSGTFDFIDMTVYFCAWVVSILFYEIF